MKRIIAVFAIAVFLISGCGKSNTAIGLLKNIEDPTNTTKPNDPTNTTKPNDPTNTTKPNDPTNTTKPNDPTNTTKPNDPTNTTKPNDPDDPTTTYNWRNTAIIVGVCTIVLTTAGIIYKVCTDTTATATGGEQNQTN